MSSDQPTAPWTGREQRLVRERDEARVELETVWALLAAPRRGSDYAEQRRRIERLLPYLAEASDASR